MSLHEHLLDDGMQKERAGTSSVLCAAGYVILHNIASLLLK